MKKYFFLGFLATVIAIFCISYMSSRSTCNPPSPIWNDQNGNGFQEPDEFIIALGQSDYKTHGEIGFPRIFTISHSRFDLSAPIISLSVDNPIVTEVFHVLLNGIWGTLGGTLLFFIVKEKLRRKSQVNK